MGDLLKPILITSMIGLVIGYISLSWFTTHGLNTLRLILGIAILASAAALLLINSKARTLSGNKTTWAAGLLTGIMGGLFATPGPPLVYHLYSQPLDKDVVRRYLFIVFSFTATIRLIIAIGTGELTMNAIVLSAIAFPAITVTTMLQLKYPLNLNKHLSQILVTALLVATGAGLIYSSLSIMFA
jgi:hypothetical protein